MLTILTQAPAHPAQTAFITVYKSIWGWKAVHYWWNAEHGGFWEPWQTAGYAFATKELAIEDALAWADSDDIPFWLDGYTHKPVEAQSESPDYDPAQAPRREA